MKTAELSIILPVRNIGTKISEILRYISAQTMDIDYELIVVDMGSTDNTVLKAISLIKELQIRGFVIQNGNSTVSTALNTGISRACGNYITFVFARRLYKDYIKGYLQTAVDTLADIVFGSTSDDESNSAQRRLISKSICPISSADYIEYIINNKIFIDIAAIMVNRNFLLEKQVHFYDLCSFGYSEEFVFRCLLTADVISQSPTIIKRNHSFELKRGKQKPIGKNIFQRIEANIRILDIIKTTQKNNSNLIHIFQQQKLPHTVMSCVDILLREGVSYNSIRGHLHAAGYRKLLNTGKLTERKLKRRITVWQILPWIYKPNK